MAFNKSLDNVKKICGIVMEENANDSNMITQIADFAFSTIADWFPDVEENFNLLEKNEVYGEIKDNFYMFKAKFDKKISKKIGLSIVEFDKFYRKNEKKILNKLIELVDDWYEHGS